MSIGPKSIRGRVTVAAAAATAVAMMAVVGITALAMQAILKATISDSLIERLDRAQALVAEGDYEGAVDEAGLEMMQILDADGNVLAGTRNAQGLKAIVSDDDDDEFEASELRFDKADDTAADDAAAATDTAAGAAVAAAQDPATEQEQGTEVVDAAAQPAAATAQSGGGGTATTRSSGSSNDDDDDDNDDHDDDSDDAPAAATQSSAPVQAPAASDDYDDSSDDYDSDDSYEASDYDDDYDDDSDDDYVAPAPTPAPAPAPAPVYHDDSDDDSSDDSDNDNDNDSDDDDDGAHSSTQIRWRVPFFGTDIAWAETEESYIDASRVIGEAGPYLVMKRHVDSPDGKVTLAAVTSLAPAVRAASLAAYLLSVVFLALLCLVVAFTWNLTAHTLRPVERMRSTAETISASDLSARIPVPKEDRDLSRLAQTFNDLLARVEASFAEQQRFISDASHELKSPVAATSIMLETLQTHPESVDATQVLSDLASENDRMGSIVSDLLALSRHDENRVRVNARPLDLMDLMLEEAAALRTKTTANVDVSGVGPVVCTADADLLSHAVRNLMENAARYAKTTVKLSCCESNGWAVIVVSDDGPGIPEEDRKRVFDRFVRLEEDRATTEGTGLGLSVVLGNIGRLGGLVAFTEPEIGGATATIWLPL